MKMQRIEFLESVGLCCLRSYDLSVPGRPQIQKLDPDNVELCSKQSGASPGLACSARRSEFPDWCQSGTAARKILYEIYVWDWVVWDIGLASGHLG